MLGQHAFLFSITKSWTGFVMVQEKTTKNDIKGGLWLEVSLLNAAI